MLLFPALTLNTWDTDVSVRMRANRFATAKNHRWHRREKKSPRFWNAHGTLNTELVPASSGLSVQRGRFTVQRGSFTVQRGSFTVQLGRFTVQRGRFTVQRGRFTV